MKTLIHIVTIVCVSTLTAIAQDFTLAQFLNVQSATKASFSPAGTELCYVTNISGEPQVWKTFDHPGPVTQLTFEEDGVEGAWWSPVDRSQMIVAASRGGSEKSKLYMMNPGLSPLVPLTPIDNDGIYRFGTWSSDGTIVSYSTNARNGIDFDVYEHHLTEVEPRLIYDGGGSLSAGQYSADNRYLIIRRDLSNVNSDLLLFDRESGTTKLLTEHTGDEFFGDAYFDQSGRNIIARSNRGREFVGIASYNIESGQWLWLETPEAEVDMLSVAPDGSGYAFIVNDKGLSRFYFNNLAKERRIEGYRFPDGIIRDMSFSPDSKHMAISFGHATKPFDIWIYEPSSDKLYQLTSSATGGVPMQLFVAPEVVEYESFDKLKIPAFFYKPVNAPAKCPVIIAIHGGPESQAQPDLSGLFQYWLYNGYAILEPNVRGSSGFGKTYLSLDNVHKRMDSVKDLEFAAKWLGARKDIDKSKIVLFGGSYGGFMVLSGLATYPDLFAAGIDVVGISNFVTFLENTGKYRKALREAEYGSITTDREFLESISPLNQVDKIKAPLFVIQGANDPRVPQTEADQMVEAIRGRGGVVEYMLFEDEGHGLRKTENKIAAYTKVVEFLNQHVKDQQ